MRAITYSRYGGPEVLQLTEVGRPVRPRRGAVLRVHAASLNPIDIRLRRGEMRWLLPGGFPRVPGFDVAGEIREVDPDSHFEVGQRVLAFLDNLYGGGYAEYAKCSLSAMTAIPDEVSFESAAALPLAGSTALQSLRDFGSIKPGDRVLINGASGGVGAFAVQIAKTQRTHVTAVASGKNENYVRSLGADEFLNYEEKDFRELDRSWNLIFDVAGKKDYWSVRRVLAKDGHFVSTEPNAAGIFAMLASRLSSRRSDVMLARPKASDLAELVRLHAAGKLDVTIADVLPLAESSKAQQMLESGGHRGKYILRVTD